MLFTCRGWASDCAGLLIGHHQLSRLQEIVFAQRFCDEMMQQNGATQLGIDEKGIGHILWQHLNKRPIGRREKRVRFLRSWCKETSFSQIDSNSKYSIKNLTCLTSQLLGELVLREIQVIDNVTQFLLTG